MVRVPYAGANNALCAVIVEGDENAIATQAWTDMSALGGSNGDLVPLVVLPQVQRVNSVRITVTIGSASGGFWGDATSDNVGGYAVAARLTCGIQPGGRRQVDRRAFKG
jgi:hypothetical protein